MRKKKSNGDERCEDEVDDDIDPEDDDVEDIWRGSKDANGEAFKDALFIVRLGFVGLLDRRAFRRLDAESEEPGIWSTTSSIERRIGITVEIILKAFLEAKS